MDEEDSGRDLHHHERVHAPREQPARQGGPERRTRRRADRDQGEETVALRARVDLIGVGPELRDGGQAEDADPDEEQEAQVRHSHPAADEEELDAADEEQDHHGQELLPGKALRDPAVQRDVQDEGEGLGGGGVGLQLGAAGEEDERLADGLQDVVADEQQVDVQAHQEDGAALSGADVAEDAQGAVQRAGRALRSRLVHRCTEASGRVLGLSIGRRSQPRVYHRATKVQWIARLGRGYIPFRERDYPGARPPAGSAGPRRALEEVGALPERAPVGHRARGLQPVRPRLGLLPPRPGALTRLPVGRRRPGRVLRRQAAALLRDRALERERPDPQGAALRPDQQRGESRRRRQGVLLLPRQHAHPLVHEVPVQVPAARLPLQPHRGHERAPGP